jgi:LysM repeat protein
LKIERILPPNLLKVAVLLLIFSFVLGNSYLSAKIGVTQPGGQDAAETIKENGLIDNNSLEANLFSQSAYAYSENIAVDGAIINLEENQADASLENFFMIVDNGSLMAVNSPLAFYLPTAKRHGILTYEVQDGDTAGQIAAKFGVSLNTILWANNLKSGSLIKPGQVLVILPISGVRHLVEKGDTISSIAKKYKASIEEIVVFNNLNNDKLLIEGQELIIPGGQLSSTSISSVASSAGLKPMTVDISSWPSEKGFFAYPASGGWNKGILHYYNAVDIINSCGSPIYASVDGIVVEARKGWNLGYGNYIKIQHFNGTLTVYGHLGDLYVKEGDKVSQGQTLGTMSDTGNANGCHLHFEIRGAQNPFVLKK